jgi:site-specific recombinase XerD
MRGIRISSSALLKPATAAGFDVLKYSGDNMGTNYREPKAVITGAKWYIEIYYRIPENLRARYRNARWKRFKIYKDINIVRTAEYAEWLRRTVKKGLEQGWSPFEELLDPAAHDPEKEWSCQQAALFFIQAWKDKGLSAIGKYERTVDRLLTWLRERKMEHVHVDALTGDLLEAYLAQQRKSLKWSNATYNGERGFLSTMCNFLHRKKIITHKIIIGEKRKVSHKKHKFYDDHLFARLIKVLEQRDPYLLFACRCVYYLCMRSELELQQLKVGDIIPERKQILLSRGKTGERYIPVPKEMMDVFKSRGILKAPRTHYVFSVQSKTAFVADGKPGAEPFGKGFFSKRFAKLRKEIGISSDYTIYGLKHTRVIHLKSAGASDADIMALTGHSTYDAFSRYLRDLGMTANPEVIDRLGRTM